MAHPLEKVMAEADGFLLIGESGKGRFPAFSYNAYVHAGKRFYCLDLDGIGESRGPNKGGKVYSSIDELPEDRDDLALIWVHPKTATRAVEVAYEAGCRRVWFSFKTGHSDAVDKARQLGMDVLEIGRCPVYYLSDQPKACVAHTLLVKGSGAYQKPPQLEAKAKRRELI